MVTQRELPVTEVVIMEDRARVERRGRIPLTPGVNVVEVPGLSSVAVDRSLQVSVQGATLVDAKIVRRWREKPRPEADRERTALRARVEAIELECVKALDEVTRLSTRAERVKTARADLLRALAEEAGAGTSPTPELGSELDTLSERQRTAEEALFAASVTLEAARQRLGEGRGALALAEQPERKLDVALALTLEGEGEGTAELQASYLVPCAVWRPAYRATLRKEQLLLEAEAVVWQRTDEPWNDVTVKLSTARPTLGTEPPSLTEDVLRTRAETAQEKRVVTVSVREQTIGQLENGGNPEMPGLDDGGEARLIAAPSRCSIPSDGQPHRIPLFSFEASAELERICPAELTPTVSLVARFPNSSGQVLLAGPVDLVRASGFVGRSKLPFAAPGDSVKLSFGSEDGLFVLRTTEEKHDEAMLTGRTTQRHTVTLRVSNARPEPATLFLEERIPISEIKEVKVEPILSESKPPPAQVSPKGIARWPVSLPPHGTTTVQFVWELSAASSVAGLS